MGGLPASVWKHQSAGYARRCCGRSYARREFESPRLHFAKKPLRFGAAFSLCGVRRVADNVPDTTARPRRYCFVKLAVSAVNGGGPPPFSAPFIVVAVSVPENCIGAWLASTVPPMYCCGCT